VQLTLPGRGRAAAADIGDAVVQKHVDMLQQRRLEQDIRLQIANAIDDLLAVEVSMRQADIERDNAQKRVAAEQRKYELGVEQLFFVLDAQTQLNLAENDVLLQGIAYRRALIGLHLAIGDLAEDAGFAVSL
jgi:outer membrane protein TolC